MRHGRDRSESSRRRTAVVPRVGARLGVALLGALLARRVLSTGTVRRAATAARGVGRVGREKGDVERASEGLAAVQEQFRALQAEVEAGVAAIQDGLTAGSGDAEPVRIRPRKSDITISEFGLLWRP